MKRLDIFADAFYVLLIIGGFALALSQTQVGAP